MKRGRTLLWIARSSWALFGGIWGARIGFVGALALPYNADSFANFFANGIFGFYALMGSVTGMIAGVLVGTLTEWLLRSVGVANPSAVSFATVVSALALWVLGGIVQAKYPGLRPPISKPAVSSHELHPAERPCEIVVPEDSPQRASWEAECR